MRSQLMQRISKSSLTVGRDERERFPNNKINIFIFVLFASSAHKTKSSFNLYSLLSQNGTKNCLKLILTSHKCLMLLKRSSRKQEDSPVSLISPFTASWALPFCWLPWKRNHNGFALWGGFEGSHKEFSLFQNVWTVNEAISHAVEQSLLNTSSQCSYPWEHPCVPVPSTAVGRDTNGIKKLEASQFCDLAEEHLYQFSVFLFNFFFLQILNLALILAFILRFFFN